jgi:hypothetical protein
LLRQHAGSPNLWREQLLALYKRRPAGLQWVKNHFEEVAPDTTTPGFWGVVSACAAAAAAPGVPRRCGGLGDACAAAPPPAAACCCCAAAATAASAAAYAGCIERPQPAPQGGSRGPSSDAACLHGLCVQPGRGVPGPHSLTQQAARAHVKLDNAGRGEQQRCWWWQQCERVRGWPSGSQGAPQHCTCMARQRQPAVANPAASAASALLLFALSR